MAPLIAKAQAVPRIPRYPQTPPPCGRLRYADQPVHVPACRPQPSLPPGVRLDPASLSGLRAVDFVDNALPWNIDDGQRSAYMRSVLPGVSRAADRFALRAEFEDFLVALSRLKQNYFFYDRDEYEA